MRTIEIPKIRTAYPTQLKFIRLNTKRQENTLLISFPYNIIYFVKEEQIIILAALHGKRNFDLLKNRVHSV